MILLVPVALSGCGERRAPPAASDQSSTNSEVGLAVEANYPGHSPEAVGSAAASQGEATRKARVPAGDTNSLGSLAQNTGQGLHQASSGPTGEVPTEAPVAGQGGPVQTGHDRSGTGLPGVVPRPGADKNGTSAPPTAPAPRTPELAASSPVPTGPIASDTTSTTNYGATPAQEVTVPKQEPPPVPVVLVSRGITAGISNQIILSYTLEMVQAQQESVTGVVLSQFVPVGWSLVQSQPPSSSFDPRSRVLKWLLMPEQLGPGAVQFIAVSDTGTASAATWDEAPAWYTYRRASDGRSMLFNVPLH